MATPALAARASQPNTRLIAALIGLVVMAIVVVVVVLKLRSSSSLDLTGKWQAQQGPTTVNLDLTGSGNHLTGTLTTKNAPLPISGTVDATVTGNTAAVLVRALGQSLNATCNVSNTKLVCTGKGGNQILTLTFTRP